MESTVVLILATDNTEVFIRLHIEVILYLIVFLFVWLKIKLDGESILCLVDNSGEAFIDIPIGFLELCMAEEIAIRVKHLGVLIDWLLHSVFLPDVKSLPLFGFQLAQVLQVALV